jgi:hypothetical protein
LSVFRANQYLDEIIQILDNHRAKFTNDDESRAYLSRDDNEWIDSELLHCMTEPRYFISNYYFYRDETQGFRGLYPLFDSQEILHDEFRRLEKEYGKVKALVNKARQMGATTYLVGEFFQKTVFQEHTNAIIVSQDEQGANYNMGMYESAFDFLPWWMKPRVNIHQTGSVYNFDERDEQLRATRPGLKTWVYADNANRPSGVGRGKTFRRGVLDELAFWKNSSQLSKSLLRTFNADDGFYCMASTANGRNDAWHNLWRKAESGGIDWHPIFIPFYRRPKTYSLPIPKGQTLTLTKEEEDMRARIMEKEAFLITDETVNWIRKTKEEFSATDGDDMMFDQEYPSSPEVSFQNSAITAIPRNVINRYSRMVREPRWVGEVTFDFKNWQPHFNMREIGKTEEVPYPETEDRLHIWKKVEPGARYCVSGDVALGQKGGDYSCCAVAKLGEGMAKDELVAVWHGWMDPYSFAEPNLALCTYYNNALSAIEVNSMGMATFTRLYREFEYENVYIYKRMDRLKNFKTDIGGWYTTYNSKRNLIAHLLKMMMDDQVEIWDKHLIDELRDFTEDGAEGEGAHDDYVMAYMIALYCGHEGEFQEMRSRPLQIAKDQNIHIVYKMELGLPVELFRSSSPFEAERFSKKRIGSYIVNEHGAMADLVMRGKDKEGKVVDRTIRVPADFQNTAFSPVHDRPGTRQKMFDEGIPAEMIDSQSASEYEARQEDEEDFNDVDAWKYN